MRLRTKPSSTSIAATAVLSIITYRDGENCWAPDKGLWYMGTGERDLASKKTECLRGPVVTRSPGEGYYIAKSRDVVRKGDANLITEDAICRAEFRCITRRSEAWTSQAYLGVRRRRTGRRATKLGAKGCPASKISRRIVGQAEVWCAAICPYTAAQLY
jgi:hypothetical protein